MTDHGDLHPGDDRSEGHDHVDAPETIGCVDCGGVCHLLTRPYEDEHGRVGFEAGDIVAYRCADCLDRWDIELE